MLIDLVIDNFRRQISIMRRNSLHLFQSIYWDEKAELIKSFPVNHPKYKYFRWFAYITPSVLAPLLTWRCINLYTNPGKEDKFVILASYLALILTLVNISYGSYVIRPSGLKKYVHCCNATIQILKRFQGKVC